MLLRIQVMKSVLFSVERFWTQIFFLPRGVLHRSERIYQSYFWSAGSRITRKSLVAWNKLCQHLIKGHWDLRSSGVEHDSSSTVSI